VVGKSGQISLGKKYAGKVLRLDRLEDGAILLTSVAVVPESQLWTLQEPDRGRIARVSRGRRSTRRGRRASPDSFAGGRGEGREPWPQRAVTGSAWT